MSLDARADRTEIRLKLYDGGFTPLANRSKMCLIRGWSTIEVTPELIRSREWARSKAFMDTGIRCGDVVAIDWDIDDPDLLNDLLDAVVDKDLIEESPFVRIGRPPRELWVYRTSEKIGKRTTGHFSAPDAPADDTGFAVEILGAGCQFAAYGQRDENTAYQWPERDLVDAHYMDLPVITKAQADALKDFCEIFLAARGLVRRSPAGGTDAGYSHVYDLTPDHTFEVKDLGVLDVAELTEVLRANPDEVLRVRVDTFRPTSGSWAGMASLVNNHLCVSDHGTYTSHFTPEQDIGNAVARLGALLAPLMEPTPEPLRPPAADEVLEALDPGAPFDTNLARALRRYVWVETDGVVCDLGSRFMVQTAQVFRTSLSQYSLSEVGPRGGDQRIWLSDQWIEHRDRLTVRAMQMRPDMPRPLFTDEDGALYVNTYQPVRHMATGGDAGLGFQLLDDLLPNAAEAAWFRQWLAHKLRYPHIPGPAVIMVARDAYGTGRGSLISLLTDLFGGDYVARIDFKTLTGQGHQSQYNEWQVENLVVAVDEAQETDAAISRWQARNNAYEHLKNIVDPTGRAVMIKRKTFKNTKATSYATIFIATNHGDALVVPDGDRRFAVLENGSPMPAEYWTRFHAWRASRANIAAFAAALHEVDIADYNPFAAPPMTSAKADMIDAGVSDVDRAAAYVFARLPGALLCRDQFLLRMEDTTVSEGYDFPEDWRRAAERLFVRKTRRMLGPDRLRIEGKPRVVRLVKPCDPDILQSETRMLEEVLRNGPVTRPIRSGNVVSFGARST